MLNIMNVSRKIGCSQTSNHQAFVSVIIVRLGSDLIYRVLTPFLMHMAPVFMNCETKRNSTDIYKNCSIISRALFTL